MSRPSALIGALATALLAGSAAFAADLVVLESNVAAFAPGTLAPAEQQVTLGAEARLVLIAPDGSARTVTGPYSGALGAAGADAPGVLQRLTSERRDANHVVGAIRAPAWDQ